MCCVASRNESAGRCEVLSSTPSSAADAGVLQTSGCSEVPDVGRVHAAFKDVVEEPGKPWDSELDELCARYGGYVRAMHAATIIQQTYRQHLLSRSFAKLRLEAGESRRSQRFARRRGLLNASHQDSIDVDRSLNLSQFCDDNHPSVQQNGDQRLSTRENGTNSVEVVVLAPDKAFEFEGHNDLEECDDNSSSSRSISPTLPSPLPIATDLPSVYFESSLEDRTICGQRKVYSDHGEHDCMLTVCPTPHSRECPSSYHRRQRHRCCYDGLDSTVCRHHHRNPVTPSHTRHSDSTYRPSHVFSAASSSFARFGVLPDNAEPSPIWKRKSGSVESYDAGVGTSLEDWDADMARSGLLDRPLSEVYPGSTTSSEDSVGSADITSHQLMQNSQHHHHNTTVDQINHSANSSTSNRSSLLGTSSDRRRKRFYRIGLNLFNR